MGLDALMGLALACRRSERIRFDYLSGEGAESTRHTEPYRLVSLGRRWYLVAFDVDRADWRTFRVDRIERVRTTGARFVVSDPPDAAALVAEGVAVRAYEERSVVRIHAPLERTLDEVAPTIGRCTPDPDDAGSTIVELGGELDWVARFLVSLPLRFEILEPAALGDELSRLGEHLVATFRT